MPTDRPDPELTAASGLARLEQYESSGSAAELTEAITCLSAALAAGRAHLDTPVWRYHLAVALGRRAAATGARADWDAAVDHLRAVRDEVADEPDVAAEIAPDLALMLFRRFHALGDRWDPEPATRENLALADEVDAVDTGIP